MLTLLSQTNLKTLLFKESYYAFFICVVVLFFFLPFFLFFTSGSFTYGCRGVVTRQFLFGWLNWHYFVFMTLVSLVWFTAFFLSKHLSYSICMVSLWSTTGLSQIELLSVRIWISSFPLFGVRDRIESSFCPSQKKCEILAWSVTGIEPCQASILREIDRFPLGRWLRSNRATPLSLEKWIEKGALDQQFFI